MSNFRAWLFIVAGILSLICGISGTQILENNRVTTTTAKINPNTPIVINGREYNNIRYIPSESIPGYTEQVAAQNKMENIVSLCYIGGVVFLPIGGIALFLNHSKKTKKIIRQIGVILEIENGDYLNSVIVEFEDYSRKKLLVNPSIALVRGDRGVIGYQGDLIVEFQRTVSSDYRTM